METPERIREIIDITLKTINMLIANGDIHSVHDLSTMARAALYEEVITALRRKEAGDAY